MMNQPNKEAARAPHENPEKDPDDWTTGDEPMTGAQRSYLKTLCLEANEEFDENLTKAEALSGSTRFRRGPGVILEPSWSAPSRCPGTSVVALLPITHATPR
jgi:hypothetical protein